MFELVPELVLELCHADEYQHLIVRPRSLGVTMGDKQSSFPGRGLDRNQHHICHAEGSQHLVVRPRCLGVTMGDKIFINQLKNPKIVRA